MITTTQKGSLVAIAVLEWLQAAKSNTYVPWVLNLESDSYDPVKAAIQESETRLLESLEQCIMDAIPKGE